MPHPHPIVIAFLDDRRGATAIEYGLIAALIVVAAIGGMNAFGSGLTGMWGHVQGSVANASGG